MKFEIFIDEHCEKCKEGIRYLKSLQKQHKGIYMNFDMKEYKSIDDLILTPDFNCMGHLTHFHINRADKDTLKQIIAFKEINEKESQKIKKLKKSKKWKQSMKLLSKRTKDLKQK